jgi:hypothetical protein
MNYVIMFILFLVVGLMSTLMYSINTHRMCDSLIANFSEETQKIFLFISKNKY